MYFLLCTRRAKLEVLTEKIKAKSGNVTEGYKIVRHQIEVSEKSRGNGWRIVI